MGSYGIGSGRLLACIAEEHHDADGLRWPVSVAPYHVQLTLLPDNAGQAAAAADKLYAAFLAAGVEVLSTRPRRAPRRQFTRAISSACHPRDSPSERSLKAGGTSPQAPRPGRAEIVPKKYKRR